MSHDRGRKIWWCDFCRFHWKFSLNTSASELANGVRFMSEKYYDDFKEDFSQEYIQFVTSDVQEYPLKRPNICGYSELSLKQK